MKLLSPIVVSMMSLALMSLVHPESTVPPEWELEYMPGSTTQQGVSAYRDLKYNRLFTRTRGWNGGDGVLTVGLPNGDVLWTFNDSFYGVVNAADRSRGSCNFPRNSIMVQRAHDGVLGETEKDLVWLADYVNWLHPSQDRYFHARTHLRHPQGNKSLAEIAAGDIDEEKVYWSGDGVVCDGRLQMVWIAVESKALQNIGTALATYSLQGNMPTGRYLDTIPDYHPRPGDYLYRESVLHDVNHNRVSYGSTICDEASDGHLYLYVSTSFHLGWRSSSTATVPIWKIDAETGEIVWQVDYECNSIEGVSGGVQSTIAVGRGSLDDYIYVTVAMTHGTGGGDFVAIRKKDGTKMAFSE